MCDNGAASVPPLSEPIPTLIPKSFDKHAALRFSLALQCIVNISAHGSKLIQSRVVRLDALRLDFVGCILKSWLASKGFCCLNSWSYLDYAPVHPSLSLIHGQQRQNMAIKSVSHYGMLFLTIFRSYPLILSDDPCHPEGLPPLIVLFPGVHVSHRCIPHFICVKAHPDYNLYNTFGNQY